MLKQIMVCCIAFLSPAITQAADIACKDSAVPTAIHNSPSLQVATLNVAHGRGTSLNQLLIGRTAIERNLDAVATSLSNSEASIVALQELDVDSRWAGNFDHANYLLESSHLQCSTLGLHAHNWLYRFGTGLLTTVALEHPVATAFAPTPPTTTKGLIAATFKWNDGNAVRDVRVASVHLDFSRKKARQRQMEEIIRNIHASTLPMVIMGDFNEEWGNRQSVVRRLVEEGGLVAHEPESSQLASYKKKRLDWILISPELEFTGYQVSADPISDHQMVLATLKWRDQT